MKRYPWEWSKDNTYLINMGSGWDWFHTWPVLPPALATRLLRRAGRCHSEGCTGSAAKCSACCGRGGGR